MGSIERIRQSGCVRLFLSALFALALAEGAARIWVKVHWTPERIEQLTTHSPLRGHFASHADLPYALNPAFPGHNALGFRGAPLERKKPAGVRRVACLGASTTYGIFVEADEAFPAQLGALLAQTKGRWEVVNAGVPGWLSTEALVDLQLHVLPLEPDVVVILQGRNELFPQAYNGFRADYTHFRRPGFNYAVSNYVHKEVFRWSRLAMLACTLRGERFGWSETEEHPLYGGVVKENRPTTEETERNLRDPARLETLRSCTESMIALCSARGIRVVVCTMAFRPDKLAGIQELDPSPRMSALLSEQIDRNNALARETSERLGATLVDTSVLSADADIFLDDCHMTAEGHRRCARMIYDALVPLLDRP
jgi:lysophospholipase L1-like esterase